MQPEKVVGSEGARQQWLSVLAKVPAADVLKAWDALERRPSYAVLRAPEIGMVMVRGRQGGTGDAFNLGEMTVTRAAVRLATGVAGVSYVAGRDRRHAEIAAALDAMMQTDEFRASADLVIRPLEADQLHRRDLAARKAAATKVDFFTMVRERGPGQ